jgi:hypothetical protein
MQTWLRGPGATLLALLLILASTGEVGAQSDAGRLALDCSGESGGVLAELCAQSALAAHALQGGIGLLVAGGGAVPVSPSTAGHRMEGSPRIVVDGGLNLGRLSHADLSRAGTEARETTTTALVGRLTATAGVFEGFSLAPTVGGVGSLDGVVTLRFVRLPSSDGFAGTTASVGAGARVGLLRESFSLPGVTLTALHHRPGTIRYGDLEETGRRMVLEPRVTSTRLEIGKDMLAVGITGGAGLDRMSGRARISVSSDGQTNRSTPRSLSQTRRYLFAGVNYTWLVTQLSGEVTWSPGEDLDDPFWPREAVAVDPSNLQLALTFRVIY